MSPESWMKQHRKVDRIERGVHASALEAAKRRRQIRAWFSRFGDLETMAWAFAAGLLWASGRGTAQHRMASRASVVRLANSALLLWRFVSRIRATGAVLGLASARTRTTSRETPPRPSDRASRDHAGAG